MFTVGAVDDSNLVDNKTTTLVPTTTTTVIDDDYNDNDDSEDDINGNNNNNNSTTDAETIITGDDEDNNEESEFREPRDPSEFMDYFDDLMGRTRVRLEELFEQYMPQLIQMSSTVQLSPQCTLDAIRILMGLRKLQPWAIKMLDSSGKVPDGILGGTLTALGSYDDCLESRIGDDQTDTDNTKGQYCAINVRPYLPPKPPLHLLEKEFNDAADAKGFAKEHHFARIAPLFYYLRLRLGICVPASCQMTDMDLITKRISYRFRVNVSVQHCDIKPESFAIESDQYGPLAVIAGLLIVIASATIYDTMVGGDGYDSSGQTTTLSSSSTTTTVVYKIRKFLANCFLTFSVRLNSSIIMSTATTNVSANHHIRPLNGLRVISLVWIMIAHTYMTLDYRATGRLITTKELPKGLIFQTILNASLAIETFFFLSGLLVTYNCIIRMNQSNRYWRLTDWLVFYIHRYIRLTPESSGVAIKKIYKTAIMLLIVIFLFGYRLGNGPLWQELIYPTAHKCRDNWWTHLLYISNFINGKDMCFLHLWYIAADMQLFILTPIFLAILHRHAYLGQLLLIISIVLSILSSGIITYIEDLPPTLLFNNPDPSARRLYGNLLFVKPYPHAAPYVVGMLTGYLLYQYSHIKLSLKVKSIGWLLATMVVVLEIFGTWIWNSGHSEPTRLVSTLYAGLSRTLWALAMAWIIVACHNGFGGTLNSILSASMFVPLSRLSYVAYLIHPGMMYVFIASTRNVYAFSHYFVIQLFFSHLTTTYIVSYLLALVIEYPFVSLETIVYKKLFSNTSTGSYSSSTSSSISHNNKPRLYAVTSVDSTASGQYFISNNSGQQDNNENNDRPHNRQQFFGDKYINTLTSKVK
ncbi:nose resistant to fluoxetine protein 6-like [Oppia nitens]|uniref:nose resistant to fluoxetine protein 6-like n=1 Tax=Oppia nitens TaxID=1686743 RepID=UPI0023DA78A1|nr:nose resistant to fluoxetine protein 6-like [Oppia nitens]